MPNIRSLLHMYGKDQSLDQGHQRIPIKAAYSSYTEVVIALEQN